MKHASGTASSLNGETYSYVVRVLPLSQFVIETTYDQHFFANSRRPLRFFGQERFGSLGKGCSLELVVV
ncbi:MAG: hypothetical protein Q8J99_18185 [Sulfuritalea sp.]|nr:hypothetical protein [Sulfuritalea sp.]